MPKIHLEHRDALAWIVIDHAERHNALTPEMMAELGEHIDTIEADTSLRAVVITGAGDKSFASGGDISRFKETRKDYDATRAAAARRYEVFERMNRLDRPVVAMIRGYCMGGGMALALQADLRFAAEDAVFAIPAARLGIAYSAKGIEWLMALVGPSVAKDILFSGRRIPSDEALRLGLVNRVAPGANLEQVTLDYCNTLTGNAPFSIAATKIAVGEFLRPAADRDLDAVDAAARRAAESEDINEGRTAFLEKRRPVFRRV